MNPLVLYWIDRILPTRKGNFHTWARGGVHVQQSLVNNFFTRFGEAA